MPPKKKKATDWTSSEGRKLLFADIRSGAIPASMDWQTAYARRPEFVVGTKADPTAEKAESLFEDRLKSARSILAAKDARADEELALLRADRLVHPVPTHNHRGEPHWEGSEAQKLLKKDVAEGKHEGMKPLDYYKSRPEYEAWHFSAATIKGHVEQEVHTRKFLKQYRGKYGHDDDE